MRFCCTSSMLAVTCLVVPCVLGPASAAADVPPAKPYGQLVDEVVDFLFSDVGDGGIRTNDNDPEGYPVPPYFYHFAIYDDNHLWSSNEDYPYHAAISYPGYTASVAIEAFLAYYRYSGEMEALNRARAFADWIIQHRTPAGDLYGNLPYSTQADGTMGGGWDGDAIMTDKPAMFGVQLLRLFDTTGDLVYWNAALEIAATLADTQLEGVPGDLGRWPFRVRPFDGLVRQDYTSHLQPAVRLFTEMAIRTGDPRYAVARDRAWQWLLNNPCNPASESYMRWEGFYEDQDPPMQTGLPDHYSAHEMIAELTRRRPPGWQQLAVDILNWAAGRYLIESTVPCLGDYYPVTREWTGWLQPTYAATLQFAESSLRLFQALQGSALQDSSFHAWAHGMAAACSHGQNQRGVAADGRMYTTVKDITCDFTDRSWYEQNFNTVKYYLALMALDPSLAPAGQNHMLWSDHAVQWILYPPMTASVWYGIAGGRGAEVLRLADTPGTVLAGGAVLQRKVSAEEPGPGWFWDAAGGVLTVDHVTDPVEIRFAPTGVANGLGLSDAAAGSWGVWSSPETGWPELRLNLENPERVTLTIFDLRGREVRRLLSRTSLPAGQTILQWDGHDDRGHGVSSGVYICRLQLGRRVESRRLTLIR